jgi:hypothetical protein
MLRAAAHANAAFVRLCSPRSATSQPSGSVGSVMQVEASAPKRDSIFSFISCVVMK